MRRVLTGLLLLAVFAATLVVTFPLEAIVRRALEDNRVGDVRVTFAEASLTWNGLLLEDVRASRGTHVLATLPWIRVRPSLGALLTGRTLPATVVGSTCEGFFDGHVSTDRVAVAWVDIELTSCAATRSVPGSLEGVADGTIELTLAPQRLRAGAGRLTLRNATWDVPGMPRHLPAEADTAEVDWRLDHDTLTIERLELDNDEFEMRADGTITIVEPVGRSTLALALDVTPRDAMPQGHRDLLLALAGGPTDGRGRRRFRVEGTLSNPVVARPVS